MDEASPGNPLVKRILEGEAPEHLRAAAARGALPLSRSELVRLQVSLLGDEIEEIRKNARSTLDGMDGKAVGETLADPECSREVLTHFAERAAGDEALAEQVAFHPSVPPAALAVLAGRGNATILDLVLTNQEMLLKHPALLESLIVNPALQADQRGRLLELLDRASTSGEGTEGEDDERELDDVEAAAQLLDVEVGELLSASEILGGEEFAESEDIQIRTTYQKIVTLGTAQKAIMAMKGGRDERTILIRDSNKIVSMGVLKNPRISEQEIESVSRMRNVSEEILRMIATHRDWSKNYTVVVGLVNNPKTPQTMSTNFITRLNNRDLKELMRSRDVPELIRRMAKRTHQVRTQPAGNKFKKKH